MANRKKNYNIAVQTVKNGYVLTFDGARQDYMYFSPEALVEGMFAHIGTKHRDQLSPSQIASIMDAASKWQGVKKATADIKHLQARLNSIKNHKYRLATQVMNERRDYIDLRHELVLLKASLNANGCDELTRDTITAILSRHTIKVPVTYSGLGVDSDDIIEDDYAEQTDGDVDGEEPDTV